MAFQLKEQILLHYYKQPKQFIPDLSEPIKVSINTHI